MEPRERDPIRGEVSRMTDDLKESARGFAQQAREASGRLSARARDEASRVVEERKERGVRSLESLSATLRDSAGRLRTEQSLFSDYADSAADRAEHLARYLRESDPEKLLQDAERFARRRPEVFVGGMFVAGLLLGRFLKSSAAREDSSAASAAPEGGSGPETSYQPESGSYTGEPAAGTAGIGAGTWDSYNPRESRSVGIELAPDDESALGV